MSKLALALLLSLTVGCAENANSDGTVDRGNGNDRADDGEPTDADGGTVDGTTVVTDIEPLLLFNLEHAAFAHSGHPDVAVHVPKGFDAARDPSVVLFFHGLQNCVANAMGSTPTACTNNGTAREPLNLIAQFDAAHVNAILVAVQLGFDAASSNPGALATPGTCNQMLSDTLAALAPHLPQPLQASDLGSVVLASHSGGYKGLGRCLEVGGLSHVRQVHLYDSFYDEYAAFSAFLQSNVTEFDGSHAHPMHFFSFFLAGTSTATHSMNLAAEAAPWFRAAGVAQYLSIDTSTYEPSATQLEMPVLFKRSLVGHYGIVRSYFGRTLQASGLEPL